ARPGSTRAAALSTEPSWPAAAASVIRATAIAPPRRQARATPSHPGPRRFAPTRRSAPCGAPATSRRPPPAPRTARPAAPRRRPRAPAAPPHPPRPRRVGGVVGAPAPHRPRERGPRPPAPADPHRRAAAQVARAHVDAGQPDDRTLVHRARLERALLREPRQ